MFNQPVTITPKQLWGAITVVAALIAATAAVTWEIRKDVVEALKRQVESYEKSTTWKLPETLAEMKRTSEALSIQLAERKELVALRVESAKAREEVARLEAGLKESTGKLASAQSTLDNIIRKAESVELAEGQSAALVENTIFLGVRIVTSTSTHIVLADRNEAINVGESRAFTFGSKSCRVTLLRISEGAPRRATFGYGCA